MDSIAKRKGQVQRLPMKGHNMKTAEEKVIELEGLGVDVSRHGASWVLQCGQRHLRVADVVRVHPSDVCLLYTSRCV